MKGDYRLMEWKKEESKTWLRNRSFVETICLFFLFFLWHFYWFLFWFRRSAWNIISFQKWLGLDLNETTLETRKDEAVHGIGLLSFSFVKLCSWVHWFLKIFSMPCASLSKIHSLFPLFLSSCRNLFWKINSYGS